MSLAGVSGSDLSGLSSELSRSSVGLGDLSGDFSVLVSCPSRLQGLFLLLFLLLRAGCSIECSRSIASALHSMSFISLESRWSVFLLLNSDTISGLTTFLSCMLRGPTIRNLAPWMSSFARYWFSSLGSWLSALLCWLVIYEAKRTAAMPRGKEEAHNPHAGKEEKQKKHGRHRVQGKARPG